MTNTPTITSKQLAWFKAFRASTGTDPMGQDHWEDGTMSFADAAQYSLKCFVTEAEEMAQGLERALQPLIASD